MHKYEREIADLIEKLESQDKHTTATHVRGRPPQLPRKRSTLGNLLRRIASVIHLSPLTFMVAGLVIVLLSALIRQHSISQWLTIIGVVLFLWPIAANLISRGRSARDTKMWRGRVVEPDEPSWSELRTRMEHAAHDFRRRFRHRP